MKNIMLIIAAVFFIQINGAILSLKQDSIELALHETFKSSALHLIVPSYNFLQYTCRQNNPLKQHYLSPYCTYLGPVTAATIGSTLLNRHNGWAKAFTCALVKNSFGWLSGIYCLHKELKSQLFIPALITDIPNLIDKSNTADAMDNTIATIMNTINEIDQSLLLTKQKKNEYTLLCQELLNQANQKLMHIEEQEMLELNKRLDGILFNFHARPIFASFLKEINQSKTEQDVDSVIADIQRITNRINESVMYGPTKNLLITMGQKLITEAHKKRASLANSKTRVDEN